MIRKPLQNILYPIEKNSSNAVRKKFRNSNFKKYDPYAPEGVNKEKKKNFKKLILIFFNNSELRIFDLIKYM